jgi:hypothetical protein
LGRYQVSPIQSGGIKDQQKVADTFAKLKLIPEPIRVNDIVVNVGYLQPCPRPFNNLGLALAHSP